MKTEEKTTQTMGGSYGTMVRTAMHDRLKYVGKDRRLNVRKLSAFGRFVVVLKRVIGW